MIKIGCRCVFALASFFAFLAYMGRCPKPCRGYQPRTPLYRYSGGSGLRAVSQQATTNTLSVQANGSLNGSHLVLRCFKSVQI